MYSNTERCTVNCWILSNNNRSAEEFSEFLIAKKEASAAPAQTQLEYDLYLRCWVTRGSLFVVVVKCRVLISYFCVYCRSDNGIRYTIRDK